MKLFWGSKSVYSRCRFRFAVPGPFSCVVCSLANFSYRSCSRNSSRASTISMQSRALVVTRSSFCPFLDSRLCVVVWRRFAPGGNNDQTSDVYRVIRQSSCVVRKFRFASFASRSDWLHRKSCWLENRSRGYFLFSKQPWHWTKVD